MIDEWINPGMISNVGFPIVITLYLLFRQEKIIKGLTTAVTQLTIMVERRLK